MGEDVGMSKVMSRPTAAAQFVLIMSSVCFPFGGEYFFGGCRNHFARSARSTDRLALALLLPMRSSMVEGRRQRDDNLLAKIIITSSLHRVSIIQFRVSIPFREVDQNCSPFGPVHRRQSRPDLIYVRHKLKSTIWPSESYEESFIK